MEIHKPSVRTINISLVKLMGKAFLFCSLCHAQLLNAASFSPSSDITIDWDTTVTYGGQWRVQGPQTELTQGSRGSNGELNSFLNVVDNAFIINSNDGNSNFDTGLVSNRFSFLTEADIRWDNLGMFIRGKAWADTVYNDDTDNLNFGTYNPNPIFGTNGGHNATQGSYTERAKDYNGGNGQLLDVYLYGNIDIGDHSLNLRAGRQVISWGEALLSGGGIATAINHVDAQIRNVPGLEVKELFLPNGAVFGQFDITDNINVEAYYQYEWQETFIDPSGTYFSEFDSVGSGGETFIFVSGLEDEMFDISLDDPDFQLYIPTAGSAATNTALISNLKEKEYAKDSGQFGIATRYLFDDGAELGFYFVKYHDKTPSFVLPLGIIDDAAPIIESIINAGSVEGDADFIPFKGVQDLSGELGKDGILNLLSLITAAPGALDYSVKYFEDIRLYGLSYNTIVGTSNLGLELNYKPNAPVLTGAVNRLPVREDIYHIHMNLLHIFGPTAFYDSAILTAETVGWVIPSRDNGDGAHDPAGLAVQNTASGWGYSMLWDFQYKNVMHGTDISVPIYVNHGVKGAMFTSGYRSKQATVSIGLKATYLSNLEYGISYVSFFGNHDDIFQRLISDRDNISINLKYAF